MMLPVFFIGGRMIYVTFNKNAYLSYSGSYVEEEHITTNSDFKEGGIYYCDIRNYVSSSVANVSFSSNNRIYFDDLDVIVNTDSISLENADSFSLDKSTGVNYFYLNFYDVQLNLLTSIQSNTNNLLFKFTYLTGNLQGAVYTSTTLFYESVIINGLDNALLYSINEINTNPLFSWASTSFLIEPFQYITNLFGMPSDSPINTLLSYWLDISIIWLVFDVVMYLPLLAHRWIDKGMIE